MSTSVPLHLALPMSKMRVVLEMVLYRTYSLSSHTPVQEDGVEHEGDGDGSPVDMVVQEVSHTCTINMVVDNFWIM